MGRKLIGNPVLRAIYLFFVFFVAIPLVYTFISVLFFDASFTENIKQLNGATFLLLAKSSLVSFTVAFFSTVAGTALGFLLYKTNMPFRNYFRISLLIPLFISPYILAVAWKDFFQLFFNTTGFISSYTGVILVHTSIFTPLSMLIVGSALSSINSQLEDSGFVITKFKSVLFKIILPLIKHALLTSFILVFILSISEFSVPAFFGLKVFTTEIFTQFSAFYNHSLAILQSALLILLCILLLLSEKKHIADASFLSVSEKGTNTKLYRLNRQKYLALIFLSIWLFISVILPFIVLIIQSFKGGTSKFVQAFELLLPTFSSSVGLAFAGAVLTVIVGFTAAFFANNKSNSNFDWLLLIVFAIPSTILGISLIKFYNQTFFNFIYAGYAIVLIGYLAKFSFISAKIIGNAIKQIPKSLDEAAQIEGINNFTRLWKILIPMIFPALFAAFIINFIFSLGELGTTIMLYPPGTEIMSIKVFTIMANAPQALTSSMTLIVFSVTLLIITGLYLMAKPFIKNYNN
jgi:ABC-type Fe3+ transport system permease subunit